jgi:signal transduction histidine kinase
LAAMAAMFRFAMIMVSVAFGACLLAVLVLGWREMRRIRRREVEGHLAFAGAVAGAVIHDFRNPMSAMRLDAQLLEQEAARGVNARAEKLGELAGRITRTLARMDEILREFLALSSPDRTGDNLFDLNDIAADCADLLKLRFERAGIRLETSYAPEKMTVRGNTTQFKRALLNILNNAVQFSPADSRVLLQTAWYGRYLEVSVSDEGPGIPPSERKRVFEMYYGRRPGGTGLGLALARAAVANCGGRIILTDPPGGHGCLVVIRLPPADA